MSIRVFAPAKINLTLEVGRPRADGFHPLQSVVAFADVGDVVEAAEGERLSLSVEGEFAGDLEVDRPNLVLLAAAALIDAAHVQTAGAALKLEKNLPVASGIGGGSSDAAAALIALNKLWKLNFRTEQLANIGRKLGADIPVCFAGTSAYMTGAGETWSPLPLPSLAAVLVNPLQPLPTPSVYREFDRMDLGASFTEHAAPHWTDAAEAIDAIAKTGNDLAAPARALMPAITEIEAALRADPRVRYAGLSGSGATMFALVDDMAQAEALADTLQEQRPDWWVTEARLAGA
jgi:4-diphosphocytidyl-2-C-methyl-D-erythritol kinase